MRFLNNGVIEIQLFKNTSSQVASLEYRSLTTSQLLENNSIEILMIGGNLGLSIYNESKKLFVPNIASYAIGIKYTGEDDYSDAINFDYDGTQFIPTGNTDYPLVQYQGNRIIVFCNDPNETTNSQLKVKFVDADTNQPVLVQWSMYEESRSVSEWEVNKEKSSSKQFVPKYYKNQFSDATYHMVYDNIPEEYIVPLATDFAFEYGDGGIVKAPSYADLQKANASINLQNNTITVKLKKAPAANNINFKFQDRATGRSITPNFLLKVTSNTENGESDNIFTPAGFSFVPKYYQKSRRSASYNIEVSSANFERITIPNVFVCNGSISSGVNNEHISVSGNTVTIKLDRIITDPQPVTLHFEDSVTGAPVIPDNVTGKASGSTLKDTFQKGENISFVPSYYTSNLLTSTYDISVSSGGYQNFNLASAFRYYANIVYSPLDDRIKVEGNDITIKLNRNFTTAQPVSIEFKDRESGQTLTPDTITVKADNAGNVKDVFQNESHVAFIPAYFRQYNAINSYGLEVQLSGYETIRLTNVFTYFGNITSALDNSNIKRNGNKITVTLDKKAPVAQPITISVQDRATGTTITPEFVTIQARNGSALKDTFLNNGQISFVPSYYTNSQLPSGYDITVQAAGYDNLTLTNAFTYNGSVSNGLNNNYISINGNSIILTLDRQAPEPTPAGNLLKNADFEGIGIPNWFQRGSDPSIMQTSSQHRSSAYSLYMAYFKNEALNNHIDQTCYVTEPGNYQFSAYINTPSMLNGAGAILMIEARDANGLLLASSNSPVLSNTNEAWQQLSTQMYAPPRHSDNCSENRRSLLHRRVLCG